MITRISRPLAVLMLFFVFVAGTPPARAHELATIETAFGAVMSAWRDVVSGVPDPRLDHSEKSARIDRLFDALKRACDIDNEAVLSKFKERMSKTNFRRPLGDSKDLVVEEKSIKDALEKLGQLAKEKGFEKQWSSVRDHIDGQAELPLEAGDRADDGPTSSAEDFITGAKKFVNPERLRLALDLFRRVIALEEERIFVLLTDHDNRPLQADTLAELVADLNFLGRQGLALARLFQIGTSTFTSAHRDATDDDGLTEDEVKKIFDEAFPKLLRSIDDLGLYYAKLIQSFSGIIYHFDPAAYEKLDRFMGMMPRKMSWQQVKTIMEEDLGRPVTEAFVSIEREPFANGSMGQIHNAVLRGDEGVDVPVVVKIQKDFVKKELAWNMNTNSIFFDFLEGVSPEEYRWLVHLLTSQATELGNTFNAETDSILEAKQQRFFRQMLQPVENHGVPKVYSAHSGSRVLTSQRIEGAQRIHTAFSPPEFIRPQHPRYATRRPDEEKTEGPQDDEEPEVEEASTDATTAPSDEKLNIGRLILRLVQTYGYRLSPTYFQVIRSLLPIAGTSFEFGKMQEKFERAGMDGFDPEVQRLERISKAYERAVIYQLLYAKELHADYNFGNALVDQNSDLFLIDFGASVQTKGLISNPVFVALGFAKGDANVILGRLTRMGHFADLNRDREAIHEEIRKMIATYEIPHRSWPGLAWMSWKKWRNREKPKPAAQNDQVLEAVEKGPSPIDIMKGKEPEITGLTPEAATTSSAARAGLSFGGTFLKMIPAYPYHRARVKWIRSTLCQKLLGDNQ